MTAVPSPGLDPRRLVRLMAAAVERCQLDLTGRVVLTEAASGAYAVTPVLAALAGAQVCALAATTRQATAAQLAEGTTGLARLAGVAAQLELITEKSVGVLGTADIVTNSGQVRPIDAAMVAQLKPSAVIPLMYEAWEFRGTDVDLGACRRRGIPVAGTSETHPAVDVFSFLGPMAVKQLHDAGLPVYGSDLLLLCDNQFASFIADYLRASGARVAQAAGLTDAALADAARAGPPDAVILALRPAEAPVLGAAGAALLAERAPGTVLVQYWGDMDRAAAAAVGGAGVAAGRPGAGAHGCAAVGGRPGTGGAAAGRRAEGGRGAGPRAGPGPGPGSRFRPALVRGPGVLPIQARSGGLDVEGGKAVAPGWPGRIADINLPRLGVG